MHCEGILKLRSQNTSYNDSIFVCIYDDGDTDTYYLHTNDWLTIIYIYVGVIQNQNILKL
jgi:hypothetical protein